MTSIGSVSGGSAAYYTREKNLFSKIDSDQDGSISKTEYVDGKPKGVSEEQAAAAYAAMDTSNTGKVSFDQFSSATSEAPESKLSSAAVDVLMLMNSRSGGAMPSSGGEDISEIFDTLDADQDGKLSEAEFLAGKPEDMSEDQASAMFDALDTESTGSITEEQLAEGMQPPADAPPMMGAGGGQAAEEVFDELDTNEDGTVSEAEFQAGKPEDMSQDMAAALFDALDTEQTGSISEEQFVQSMQRGPGGPPMMSADEQEDASTLADLLAAAETSTTSETTSSTVDA